MAKGVLMSWGPLQFAIHPLNFHELIHRMSSDYARKDVLDAPPRREYVGEGDETIHLRGRVFPRFMAQYSRTETGFRGSHSLQKMDQMRRQHLANQLIRGGLTGGEPLGWFVLETLEHIHTSIADDGVGKVINFDGGFARVDIPDPANYATDLFSILRA